MLVERGLSFFGRANMGWGGGPGSTEVHRPRAILCDSSDRTDKSAVVELSILRYLESRAVSLNLLAGPTFRFEQCYIQSTVMLSSKDRNHQ